MKQRLAQNLFLTGLLFTALSAQHAQASCGDRPGTPINLTATLRQGLSPLIVLTWQNRASEKVWWDVEITNGSGVPVDSARAGTGRGDQGKGLQIQNTFSAPANGTRCYRVRARTEPGTQGCVSGNWSNQSCVTVGNGGALSYGPDTCKTGLVWRETVPTDHVCVSLQSRADAKRDNASAVANRAPGGGPYGVDTCKRGLVWREAFANDHVCVSTRKRDDTKAENLAAATNKVRR